jgi:cytoskeleton protein RodZ
MTDATTPRTPGELLRAARQARSLTVAEVSERTKIPPRLVEAIERDEYHKLSGGLYVKSFLRTYAGCVGLDEADLLAVYEQAAGTAPPPAAAAEDTWVEEETTVRRVGVAATTVVGRIAIVVGGLGLVGLLIWRLIFADQGG